MRKSPGSGHQGEEPDLRGQGSGLSEGAEVVLDSGQVEHAGARGAVPDERPQEDVQVVVLRVGLDDLLLVEPQRDATAGEDDVELPPPSQPMDQTSSSESSVSWSESRITSPFSSNSKAYDQSYTSRNRAMAPERTLRSNAVSAVAAAGGSRVRNGALGRVDAGTSTRSSPGNQRARSASSPRSTYPVN
jgi:hypothetical protein